MLNVHLVFELKALSIWFFIITVCVFYSLMERGTSTSRPNVTTHHREEQLSAPTYMRRSQPLPSILLVGHQKLRIWTGWSWSSEALVWFNQISLSPKTRMEGVGITIISSENYLMGRWSPKKMWGKKLASNLTGYIHLTSMTACGIRPSTTQTNTVKSTHF